MNKLMLSDAELRLVKMALVRNANEFRELAKSAPEGEPDPDTPEAVTSCAYLDCADRLTALYEKIERG